MGAMSHIEPARPEDAAEIMDVVQIGLPSEILDLTTFGSARYAQFVHAQIVAGNEEAGAHFLVARVSGRLAGCAELRRCAAGLFINNMVVRPEHQARGIGRQFLKTMFHGADQVKYPSVLLDVFEENARARTWYERLGFQHIGMSEWWEFRGTPTRHDVWATLVDYLQALVEHERFGFSRFTVVTPERRYEVGRLHGSLFRLVGSPSVEDATLHDFLSGLEPDRRILAIVPAGAAAALRPGWGRRLQRHCRMSVPIADLRAHLDRE